MTGKFIQYDHHGKKVWVNILNKGMHRQNCLCYSCASFHPENRDANCPIANKLFALDVEHDLVTPVFECPVFEEIKNEQQQEK